MDLAGLFEWVKEQATYILFIILIIGVLVLAFKRAWIQMIGLIIGLAVVGIFIANPNVITDVADWLSGKVSLG